MVSVKEEMQGFSQGHNLFTAFWGSKSPHRDFNVGIILHVEITVKFS